MCHVHFSILAWATCSLRCRTLIEFEYFSEAPENNRDQTGSCPPSSRAVPSSAFLQVAGSLFSHLRLYLGGTLTTTYIVFGTVKRCSFIFSTCTDMSSSFVQYTLNLNFFSCFGKSDIVCPWAATVLWSVTLSKMASVQHVEVSRRNRRLTQWTNWGKQSVWLFGVSASSIRSKRRFAQRFRLAVRRM